MSAPIPNDDYKMTWKDKLGCAALIAAGLLGLVCVMPIAHGWYKPGLDAERIALERLER